MLSCIFYICDSTPSYTTTRTLNSLKNVQVLDLFCERNKSFYFRFHCLAVWEILWEKSLRLFSPVPLLLRMLTCELSKWVLVAFYILFYVLEIRWRLRFGHANLQPRETSFGELTKCYETTTRCTYTEQNKRTHEGVHVHTSVKSAAILQSN